MHVMITKWHNVNFKVCGLYDIDLILHMCTECYILLTIGPIPREKCSVVLCTGSMITNINVDTIIIHVVLLLF